MIEGERAICMVRAKVCINKVWINAPIMREIVKRKREWANGPGAASGREI
jgi:hypothetical protein